MQTPLPPAALSAPQAAAYVGISERQFHLFRNLPSFPRPRVIGNRNKWLRTELDRFVEMLPLAEPRTEPHQLALSTKRKPKIEPRPEVWPAPRHFDNSTLGTP